MDIAVTDTRIAKLRAHLARDGKRRDFQSWQLLGRLLAWRASPEAVRQDGYNAMLREMYSPESLTVHVAKSSAFLSMIRRAR